ncbi:MAG: SpoIID/LytB domain-containing protein [Phycisphaerales bacterium]|nr:SpoIID/LytB domain-containing protein [Phycisphaerales bacterium]
MAVNSGWQAPTNAARFFATLAAVVLVAWGYMTIPSGCETPSASRSRTVLPGSPLEKKSDGISVVGADTPRTVSDIIEKPTTPPPQERPFPPTGQLNIRVRVAALRGEPVQLTHSTGWLWLKGESMQLGRTFRAPIAVYPTTDGWRIVEANGTTQASNFRLKETGALQVQALQNARGEIQFDGNSYVGNVNIVRRADVDENASDLVFIVPLEQYLPGVLAKELFKGWQANTYQAQAIAARSYAVCEMEWWRNRRHYDVVAGQASQAWVGATSDAKSLDAVASTRGEYLVFDGRVVPAYYSSCCGGLPSSAVDSIRDGTWTQIAPLNVTERGRRTQCCEKAPTANWQVSFAISETAERMNEWAKQNGRKDLGPMNGIKTFVVGDRNSVGRSMSFFITDRNGKRFIWDAGDFRVAMNAGADSSRDSLKSSALVPRMDSGRLIFDGRGHGHGAGMCQYGAEFMSKNGKSAQSILERYYPSATLVTMPEISSENVSSAALVPSPKP